MKRLYACSISARNKSDNSLAVMPCSTRASSLEEATKLSLHFAIDTFDPSLYSEHMSSAQLVLPDLIISIAQEIEAHGQGEYTSEVDETYLSVPLVFRDAFGEPDELPADD